MPKSERYSFYKSERYNFYAVGSTFLSREMQIVSTLPALPKAPTVPLFSVLSAKFPILWLAKRILLLAGDVELNPGPDIGVCIKAACWSRC